MKISEMTNDQATEALIRLSVPVGNICDDEKTVKLIEKFSSINDLPMLQVIGKLMPQIVTYAMREHKEDLYEIVGALTFKKQDEVAQMKFIDTVKALKDSYDEVLKDFFTSSARRIKKTADE